MTTKPGSAVILYAHPDQVEAVFAESLTRLLLFDANGKGRVTRDGGVISMGSGPLIASARNQLVTAFLASDAEWALMLDADMTFAPDTLERLIAVADQNALPVVGGLCFGGGRSGTVTPTMYRIERGIDGCTAPTIGVIEEWPDGGLIRVDATGAACLLMHRSILEKIRAAYPTVTPWFFTGIHADTEFGEDFGFCLRVAAVGAQVHVHTGVQCGHSKRHILDITDFDAYKTRRDEVGDDGIRNDQMGRLRVYPDTERSNVLPFNRATRRQLARKAHAPPEKTGA